MKARTRGQKCHQEPAFVFLVKARTRTTGPVSRLSSKLPRTSQPTDATRTIFHQCQTDVVSTWVTCPRTVAESLRYGFHYRSYVYCMQTRTPVTNHTIEYNPGGRITCTACCCSSRNSLALVIWRWVRRGRICALATSASTAANETGRRKKVVCTHPDQ